MFCVDDPAGRIINHSLSHEGEAHVIPPTAELEIAWSCKFHFCELHSDHWDGCER